MLSLGIRDAVAGKGGRVRAGRDVAHGIDGHRSVGAGSDAGGLTDQVDGHVSRAIKGNATR